MSSSRDAVDTHNLPPNVSYASAFAAATDTPLGASADSRNLDGTPSKIDYPVGSSHLGEMDDILNLFNMEDDMLQEILGDDELDIDSVDRRQKITTLQNSILLVGLIYKNLDEFCSSTGIDSLALDAWGDEFSDALKDDVSFQTLLREKVLLLEVASNLTRRLRHLADDSIYGEWDILNEAAANNEGDDGGRNDGLDAAAAFLAAQGLDTATGGGGGVGADKRKKKRKKTFQEKISSGQFVGLSVFELVAYLESKMGNDKNWKLFLHGAFVSFDIFSVASCFYAHHFILRH